MINARQQTYLCIDYSIARRIGASPFKKALGSRFADIIDILIYFISIQFDINEIGQLETSVFQRILQSKCEVYAKKSEAFSCLIDAWENSSDSMEGDAKRYMEFFPGIGKFYQLQHFFYWSEKTGQGWEAYQSMHIFKYVFPRWKYNIDQLDLILDMAEDVCKEIRKELANNK